jgi:hypothetical protein
MDWRQINQRVKAKLVEKHGVIYDLFLDSGADTALEVVREYISEMFTAHEPTVDEAGVVTPAMIAAAHEAYDEYGRVECEPDFSEALLEAVSAAIQANPAALERLAHPLVSIGGPVYVVFTEQDRGEQGPEELKLGPFNQGVRVESLSDRGNLRENVIDIAAGRTVACRSNIDWQVNLPAEGGVMPICFYRTMDVQA